MLIIHLLYRLAEQSRTLSERTTLYYYLCLTEGKADTDKLSDFRAAVKLPKSKKLTINQFNQNTVKKDNLWNLGKERFFSRQFGHLRGFRRNTTFHIYSIQLYFYYVKWLVM